MLKQKYFLADIFILSAEKQPIKLSWRKIEWLPGLIKNLKVITNDVYLDFNNIKEKHKMNNPFSGVLFYWEVDNECIDNFVNNIKI